MNNNRKVLNLYSLSNIRYNFSVNPVAHVDKNGLNDAITGNIVEIFCPFPTDTIIFRFKINSPKNTNITGNVTTHTNDVLFGITNEKIDKTGTKEVTCILANTIQTSTPIRFQLVSLDNQADTSIMFLDIMAVRLV